MQNSNFPKPQLIHSAEALLNSIEINKYSRLFILCDENTHRFCWPILEEALIKQKHRFTLHVEAAGEATKDWRVCLNIWEKLSKENADRQTLLLNLGGGMVSDLGAFVASIYKRGIPFIHLPTSLLAMTDAAIGGKCGIDFMHFKNQLGLFARAEAILIYPPFLKTLSTDERKSGFAEVLKHALIADADYWEELIKVNPENWQSLANNIEKSVQIKSRIVEEDPLEKGNRKKLNFGHTVGHAIESYCMKIGQPIPHGFAIAAGIYIESFLSIKYLNLPKEVFNEIAQTIQHFYAKVDFSEPAIDEIVNFIQQDKKSEMGKSRFTLLKQIGSAEIDVEVSEMEVKTALLDYVANNG